MLYMYVGMYTLVQIYRLAKHTVWELASKLPSLYLNSFFLFQFMLHSTVITKMMGHQAQHSPKDCQLECFRLDTEAKQFTTFQYHSTISSRYINSYISDEFIILSMSVILEYSVKSSIACQACFDKIIKDKNKDPYEYI